jgi:hypothetical protein
MVGTTNKSIAAMSGGWLHRNVRHPWLGGPRRLTTYSATLDCATSKPELEVLRECVARPKADFRAHPPDQRAQIRLDLRAALPMIVTSRASSSESRPCANAGASRHGRS